ncbi:MAG TPA: glycosyltransferase 87 family protein [Solirubrobacteraceae bacterium]|nr:glycosyltransferase 87 family protein [Solirubrobacteraceae bacterium]
MAQARLRDAGGSAAALVPLRALPSPQSMALVGACVLVIALCFLPLTPMYDFNVFLHAGRVLLRGLSVYPNPRSPAVYSGSSFVYPYLISWPFAALALLPGWAARLLFFLLGALAVVAATLIAGRRDAIVTVLVLATAFTITGLQLGALSPLLFAGAVLLWALRERPRAFGITAALVVASKLFLASLLLWPLLAWRRRAFAWACSLSAAIILAGFLVGPLGPGGYLHLLVALGRHESGSGFSLMGALKMLGMGSLSAESAVVGCAAMVLGYSYLSYRRCGEEAMLFSGGIIASLLATPILWSHYLALLAAILLVNGAPRRWFVALALASWVISPPHGITIPFPPSKAVPAHGAWLTLIGALVVCAYALSRRARAPGRGMEVQSPGAPAAGTCGTQLVEAQAEPILTLPSAALRRARR